MLRHIIVICLLPITITFTCYGQTTDNSTIFGEFDLSHTIRHNDKWKHELSGSFKNFFSNKEWTRVGVNWRSTRNLGQWAVDGGIQTNFTFDKVLSDYYEIRPSVSLNLTTPVLNRLDFKQRMRFEWRNTIHRADSLDNSSTRVRYRIQPTYRFKDNLNRSWIRRGWTIASSTEWYFISKKNIEQRFNNSLDINTTITKEINDKHSLSLEYSHEKYNKVFNPDKIGGNTVQITYTF